MTSAALSSELGELGRARLPAPQRRGARADPAALGGRHRWLPSRPASQRCRWPDVRGHAAPAGWERAALLVAGVAYALGAAATTPVLVGGQRDDRDPHRPVRRAGHCPLAAAPSAGPGARDGTPTATGSSSGWRSCVWELAGLHGAREPGRPSDLQLHGRRGGPLLRCSRRCCSSPGSACAPSWCERARRRSDAVNVGRLLRGVGGAGAALLGLWALSRRAGSGLARPSDVVRRVATGPVARIVLVVVGDVRRLAFLRPLTPGSTGPCRRRTAR